MSANHRAATRGKPRRRLAVKRRDIVFRGLRLRAAGGGGTLDIAACQAPARLELDQTGVIEGDLVFVPDACSAIVAPAGAVVMVNAGGGCGTAAKARQARDAGARAIILVEGSALVTPFGDAADLALPLVGIGPEDGARLRAAERLSERAILRGLDLLKTPRSSVRASLSRVTRADQRRPPR